jgi:hypothetical protein
MRFWIGEKTFDKIAIGRKCILSILIIKVSSDEMIIFLDNRSAANIYFNFHVYVCEFFLF